MLMTCVRPTMKLANLKHTSILLIVVMVTHLSHCETANPGETMSSTPLPSTQTVANTSTSTTSPPILLCNNTYTMHSDADRTCFTGLKCDYGKCDPSGFSCICDPGAFGFLCNEECCLGCGDHGNCFYDIGNDETFCNCEIGFRGERCEISKEAEHSTTTSETSSATERTPTSQTTESPLLLCNKTYIMRTEAERECFPGLQCIYGKCETSAGFGCICDPGATGVLCGEECCLDCGNHGHCFYDSINDEEVCNCDFDFTGERCEIRKEAEHSTTTSETPSETETTPISQTTDSPFLLCNKTYTMRTEAERECFPGLQCIYGKCEPSGFGCICDPGATGILCGEECCLDCGNHGNCFYDSINDEEVCNCDFDFTGERCEIRKEAEHSTTTSETPSETETTPISQTTDSPFLLCNKAYTMHSDADRTCLTGLKCDYGKCDTSGFSCICDPGAVGFLCNEECCLDCGNHGNCFYDIGNDETFCNCDFDFTGERCEIRKEAEHSTTTSETPSETETTPISQTTVSPFLLCNKTYTMRTDAERECFPGLQCMYGKCEPSGFGCICDPGATGILCGEECCLDCGNHGHCFYDSINDEEVCNCEYNFQGARCEEEIECSLDCPEGFVCTVVSGSAIACTPEAYTTPSGPGSLQTVLCNKTYTMRNLSERQCPGGLVCQLGFCMNNGDTTQCACDDGAHGLVCENACCKDCGGNGTCFYDVKLSEEVCNCAIGYFGDVCSGIITTPAVPEAPPADEWYLWVVGVTVGVLVIFIILLAVLPYVLWRHRVIVVMKIVHYFQRYEDDDEREWDAFISYKSDPRDEDFVVNVLFPKLERDLGFKTHVHFKDFIPGDTIANNIIRAVQGSRRTILVVTPNFVKSEFTRFEYQVAQQEMLKHKHRIIPILLDDISEHEETLDPNLKAILGAVTYIKWPVEQTDKKIAKFWKRLQLSLPKKRSATDQPGDIAARNNSLSFKLPNPAIKENIEEQKNPDDIVINVPDGIIKDDIEDDAEYDRIDNMTRYNIDELQRDNVDELQRDRIDNTQHDEIDELQRDRIDNTQHDEIDELQRDRIDNTQHDEIDELQRDRIDNMQRDEIDEMQRDRIDNMQHDEIDELQRDRIDNTQHDEIDELQRDRIDNMQRDEIDELQRDRIDNMQRDKIDELQRDEIDKLQGDKLNEMQREKQNELDNDVKENVDRYMEILESTRL